MALAKPTTKYNLAIIDGTMPNILSAFRVHEFEYLLKKVPNSVLYSFIDYDIRRKHFYDRFKIYNIKTFQKQKDEFVEERKVSKEQVQPFRKWTKINTDLCYVVFLSNAYKHLDYLEKNRIKFILELYPGGGLAITTEGESYQMMKRVLSSPSLAAVITTMRITQEFVVAQNFCDPAKIFYCYGVILTPEMFNIPAKTITYPATKETLDVCFAANKYMPQGKDKGYDIFIDAAIIALRASKDFHFHIIGGYNENDVEIPEELKAHFKFYGSMKSHEFPDLYKTKDIFISPSRPFTLGKGAFDGFPTASCDEAGLNGLCMIFSDPLNLNEIFVDKEDAIFLENDPVLFANELIRLKNSPSEIYRIGENGKKAFNQIHPDQQLKVRLDIINKFI